MLSKLNLIFHWCSVNFCFQLEPLEPTFALADSLQMRFSIFSENSVPPPAPPTPFWAPCGLPRTHQNRWKNDVKQSKIDQKSRSTWKGNLASMKTQNRSKSLYFGTIFHRFSLPRGSQIFQNQWKSFKIALWGFLGPGAPPPAPPPAPPAAPPTPFWESCWLPRTHQNRWKNDVNINTKKQCILRHFWKPTWLQVGFQNLPKIV